MAGLMVVKIRCKARSKPWISHFTCTESNANEREHIDQLLISIEIGTCEKRRVNQAYD